MGRWETKYGGNGGSPFKSTTAFSPAGPRITGVRLHGGTMLDAIEFQVAGVWEGKHGGGGGSSKSLILDEDEYFQEVKIRSGAQVDALELITNKVRSIKVGGGGGIAHSEGGASRLLVDCRGRSGKYVDELQFMWVDSDIIEAHFN